MTQIAVSGADGILDRLVNEARRRRASDAHLTPMGESVEVAYRVDGRMHPRRDWIAAAEYELLAGRLKVLTDLNIAERRRPQSGSLAVASRGRVTELRVSFLPAVGGETLSVRFVTEEAPESLGELGLDAAGIAAVQGLLERPSGLILAVGPTGSGKTTTLYAMLRYLAGRDLRILTVEDPVERPLPGAIQVGVRRDEGLDFPQVLAGVLRHDPDVIMVGEIREAESAAMALAAAHTGHRVLATLHAEGPLTALERLVHFAVDRGQLVAVLAGIVSQRLVRRACSPCGGRTCPRCAGCGFHGRAALIAPWIPGEEVRRQLLADRPDLLSRGEILEPLVAQARELARRGGTTLAEVGHNLQLPAEGMAGGIGPCIS